MASSAKKAKKWERRLPVSSLVDQRFLGEKTEPNLLGSISKTG